MSLSQAPAQPWAADPPPGYRLLDEVGHGRMGVIWLAHDLSLDRMAAIKFLKPERAGDAAAKQKRQLTLGVALATCENAMTHRTDLA
jgi:serine/threonine protein kinase